MKNKLQNMIISIIVISILLTGCSTSVTTREVSEDKEPIELIWYQIGDKPKDLDIVLEQVNMYIEEKLGVTLQIENITWQEYSSRMQVIVNSGAPWDLCFTSAWANEFTQNVDKGAFLSLNKYLEGNPLLQQIDPDFWKAVTIDDSIYGIPNEKEIAIIPQWVFNKDYVDKYDIPYYDLHSLEDLEPYLRIIKEREEGIVPLYITSSYSVPTLASIIQGPIGVIEVEGKYKVVNIYKTKEMVNNLNTMHRYYNLGYINQGAATAVDNKEVKRFITKGDGHAFSRRVWSADLGYDVMVSDIMKPVATNESARGAITAINANSLYKEKAVELVTLINTDVYLRNLLNYGIQGMHYELVNVEPQEIQGIIDGKFYHDVKVKLDEQKAKDYSVSYWVQGGMFNTYVLDAEPFDKWAQVEEKNKLTPQIGYYGKDFNLGELNIYLSVIENIMDEYGAPLHSGTVDPQIYLPQLNEKLEKAGIQFVIDELQSQLDAM